MSKIEMFKSEKDKKFYFRITARNGKIVAQSEGYQNRGGVRTGIGSLKKILGTVKHVTDLTTY
jgi:uncharacterized protein YegP (UPF0339 family)